MSNASADTNINNGSDCQKEADMLKQRTTILYERLSRDDGEDSVSNSIQNQQHLLEKYAEEHNLKPYRHIQDDGFSGTVWTRPGWQELMAEVEAGRVGTIIVKNLDRMGRDYLRVGILLEQFVERKIRFIALHDNIDTAKGEDDFTPLRALFAEWLARDTSKKIRAVFKARTEAGYHCTGAIPYGYIHDPTNRQNWLVDEEAAKTIRHIFQLVIEGNGVYQIAKILEQEKVLIPTAHYEALGISECVRHNYRDPYMWRGGVVSNISQREEYMGNKVLRKGYNDNYKQKKRMETPKDERLVFEGAVPQIVTPEIWHTAQRLRKTVRRPTKNGDAPYRLTGLLYCADCNSKMTHDRTIDTRYSKYRPKNDYLCSNYRQRTRECTMHFIRVPVVEDLILDTIKRVSYYVRTNEAEFVEKIREASATRQETVIKESKQLLSKHKRRRDELDTLIKKLYESFATGKIPERHFEKLLNDYDGEQTSLEASIAELQREIDTWSEDISKTDKFIEIVRRYTNFDELSNKMVNEFIEKIIVHEADKSTGKREQKVDIYLNFIGKFETPPMDIPLSEKEIAAQAEAERLAQEKLEIQRAKQREKNRKYREKVKATGDHEALKAQRRIKYAEKRNALIAQAILEGAEPPKPYKPQKKYKTA